MRPALLAVLLCSCATSAPRPPARVADSVDVQMVQVGWYQLDTGQLNKPPVTDARPGHGTPDPTQAREIADKVLDQCQKGFSMESLQQKYSEERAGTLHIDPSSRQPFRDLALSLKPGDCALYHSNFAFHVLKRVQ